MKGFILPSENGKHLRWVVKDDNRKEIIGLMIDDHWFGIDDIFKDEGILKGYYHNRIKKGVKDD